METLQRDVLRAFLEQPLWRVFPPKFTGWGLYGAYYNGPFPPYRLMAEANQDKPGSWLLYLGSTSPPGARKGKTKAFQRPQPKLWSRMRKHNRTIGQATNIKPEHIHWRYLRLKGAETSPKSFEDFIIRMYKPLWNDLLDGFARNRGAKADQNQSRSAWDTFHETEDEGLPPIDVAYRNQLTKRVEVFLHQEAWRRDLVPDPNPVHSNPTTVGEDDLIGLLFER